MQRAAAVDPQVGGIKPGQAKHPHIFVDGMVQGQLKTRCDQARLGVIRIALGSRVDGWDAIQVLVEFFVAINKAQAA